MIADIRSTLNPFNMSQATIHSHKYQHFENLQMSSHDFYATLETTIKAYGYPKVTVKRETIREGGFFSSSREYLCIAQNNAHYYVCAAPFGKSFFISWWLKEREGMLSGVAKKYSLFAFLTGQSRTKTFYEIDSELMFMSSVNSIIQTAVNKLMAEKGFTTPQELVS